VKLPTVAESREASRIGAEWNTRLRAKLRLRSRASTARRGSGVSRAGWARLSGAARLGKGAGHGGPTKRQHERETPRPVAGGRGAIALCVAYG
jgi:hypothetical protein